MSRAGSRCSGFAVRERGSQDYLLIDPDFEYASFDSTLRRSLQQELTFRYVAGHGCRALELGASFLWTAELQEQVAAHTGKKVVVLQQPLRPQPVHDGETGLRAERHRDGHGPVQLHDRRRRQTAKLAVECHDAEPVRVFRRMRPGMTGRNGRLKCVLAAGATERLSMFQRPQAATNQELVPQRAVL